MDDRFLVRVLHAIANFHEQFEPLLQRQLVLVAIAIDRDARHELHHEVRPAFGRRTAVEDARDVRVIHHRERLAFGFEPRDDGFRVHPRFDQLECDGAMNRLFLLGEPHFTHAAFAEQAHQAIRSDAAFNLRWTNRCLEFGRLACVGLRGRLYERPSVALLHRLCETSSGDKNIRNGEKKSKWHSAQKRIAH